MLNVQFHGISIPTPKWIWKLSWREGFQKLSFKKILVRCLARVKTGRWVAEGSQPNGYGNYHGERGFKS